MDYKIVKYGRKQVRRNYSKVKFNIELPDLIEIQTKSFEEFVQKGLREVFDEVSPIKNQNGTMELYFDDYHFEEPKMGITESKLHGINYSRALKVNVRIKRPDGSIYGPEEIFMGDIQYMTPVGTFVVNGAERVIVSQIVRSAGAYFSKELDKKLGESKFTGQVMPTRGAWIEFETGSKDVWYAKLDRSKKIPMTTFLRTFGLSTNEEITQLFFDGEAPDSLLATFEKDSTIDSGSAAVEVYSKLRQGEKVPADGARGLIADRLFNDHKYELAPVGRHKVNKKLDVLQRCKHLTLAENVINKETGEVIVAKGALVDKDVYEILKNNREHFTYEVSLDAGLIDEPTLVEILYVNPKDMPDKKVKVIGNNSNETQLHVTISDIFAAASYYFNLFDSVGTLDDIDHLGNRRLRLIGELLKNQFKTGFAKLEKNIKDRMSTVDPLEATPKTLINVKPLTSSLKEFFGSSQLSQFMDQINPLAEITQKRRISALGSGGIARDRASVKVRDVHVSHYGRMCPIETPEGPSIGLISSLSTYAKTNEYGFIVTPYLKVNNCVVDDTKLEYLSADMEEEVVIASASTLLDDSKKIIAEKVMARRNGENIMVAPEDVDYIDVSPKQIVSVATSCIPFLEHDDATRALMGANMQRQAVPLISTESPMVGTGIEYKAAKDSGIAIVSDVDGIVTYCDGKKIVIKSYDGVDHVFECIQYIRSNQDTCLLQRPIVREGEEVKAGDVIADGPSTSNGELSLGKNMVIAFMTWNGYNFEDAVIMSERLVKEDVYTSIHIYEEKIEARDTKLGREEITREIPNVSADALKMLDEDGIIIEGSEVHEGDILVGKVTPKGQTEPTPEEKLLLAIFGEKSRDVRDTSLKVPHGSGGIVQSVKRFKRSEVDLPPSVNEVIKIYIVNKRKISEGDKMAGRHGNKGVISKILPVEDMPYLADGTPVDIMLNPQGVPSRMNIGQVLEIHLGMAAKRLGIKVATPVFDGVTQSDLESIMAEAGMSKDGKEWLYDGRSGEKFENRVAVGVMYFVKLSHMVEDKLHARAVGPYTLVTQQPMGGKAQKGGQRFGEMEVWALEAYGASYTLREMLTIKSDDIIGRNNVFKAITEGKPIPAGGLPESFRVLTRELQALAIHVELINAETGENEANKSLVEELEKEKSEN